MQISKKTSVNDLESNDDSEFVSRHNIDGTFTFVDLRVANMLGYQPKVNYMIFIIFGQKSCFGLN